MDSSLTNRVETRHRFLDETGDTTFFGKGRKLILGQEGVSFTFGMGIVRIDRALDETRQQIRELQNQIENDQLLNTIPSVKKRIEQSGFFFHACKDSPDVRTALLRFIKELPCEVEIVIARKIPRIFENQHNAREDEFYADLLSHLIKGRLKKPGKLVLNVAQRGSSTREKVLTRALEIATDRAIKRFGKENLQTEVVFNIQSPLTEPLLCVSDYLCWAVQRVFEKGETRFYDFLADKIRLVIDLYDTKRYRDNQNYYDVKNPLTTANKIGPPIT
jgi:hypothetical protein